MKKKGSDEDNRPIQSVSFSQDVKNDDESARSESSAKNAFFNAVTGTVDVVTNTVTHTVETVTNTVTHTVQTVIPKFEPISTKDFLMLSFFAAIPTLLYILGFTKMGFGLTVYKYLSSHFEQHATLMGAAIAGAIFVLYVFDAPYWKKNYGKIIRRICYTIVVLGIIVVILSVAGNHPYGPICVYLVITTMWMISVQRMYYSTVETRNFVSWLGGPFFFVSFVTFLSWFIWTFLEEDNEWNLFVQLIDAQDTGCEPNFNNREDCRDGSAPNGVCFYKDPLQEAEIIFPNGCDPVLCPDIYDKCTQTFIIWVGPFLASVGMLFLSFFTTLVQEKTSTEQEMARFSKIWMVLLFGLWVSASLAGAGADVTYTLAALTLAGFIASGVFLGTIYKRVDREEQVQQLWDSFVEKYEDYLDMFRGLLVLTCSPVALAYFGVSFMKQWLRSLRCIRCSKVPLDSVSLRDIGGASWLTIEARRLVREYMTWKRSKVYTWAVYWGIAYITLTVIASKFTTLFLSWLIEETKEMSLGVVTGIMVGVGMTMFLLPPVPGAPIYLTVGIVIIPVAKDSLGLFWCMVYAIAVSLALKLLATALQQKAIGSLLKNNVGIRKMVGVNSPVMRSFKLLLSEPGLGLPKVSILTGGPDWPTSVYCGLIGLPLLPILIGTIPCLLLIIPTVLTGSFTYMTNMQDANGVAEYPWAGAASSICAALTAVVLFGNMILAAYFVEETMTNRKEELDKMPYDEEVKKLEEEEEELTKAFEEVTEWDAVPLSARITLFLACVCMVLTCYMVSFFQNDCYETYALTDTIEVHLEGNWLNLVKPAGWVSLALFGGSILLLLVFSSWANRKAAAKVKGAKSESSEDSENFATNA